MNERTCNGWTNYATWRVALEIFDGYDWEDNHFDTLGALADQMSETADDAITNYGELEGLAVDYARSFLSDVNYWELAEHHAEDNPGLVGGDEDDETEVA